MRLLRITLSAILGVGGAHLAQGQTSPYTAMDSSTSVNVFPQSNLSSVGVMSSKDIRIFPDSLHQTEFSIAINPSNPENIVAGANVTWYRQLTHTIVTAWTMGEYYSSDGGRTWSGTDSFTPLTIGSIYPSGSDPAIAFGPSNAVYYAYLSKWSHNNSPCSFGWTLRFRKSTDGGITWWSSGAEIPHDSCAPDKPHIAADGSNVYFAWSDLAGTLLDTGNIPSHGPYPIMFARSTDGGNTFDSNHVRTISGSTVVSGAAMAQGVNLAVGTNHEIYATWAIYDSLNYLESWRWPENALGFTRSLDYGATWDTARRIFNITGLRYWLFNKNNQSLGIRANSFPVMAVDRSSGAYNGTIYIVWDDKRNGDPDILLSKSTDRGLTWSAPPTRVNQDPIGDGKDQWMPWVTVNPDGVINVVFYDSRNDPNNKLTATWIAQSTDGGVTFKDFQASDTSFMPVPIAGGYMGDYLGITSTKEYSYPCWPDIRTLIVSENQYKYQAFVDLFGSYKIVASVSASAWNMVSVPDTLLNFSKAAVFPSALGNAWAYNGSTYYSQDPLSVGPGYWIKLGSMNPATVTFVGRPTYKDTLNVGANWNMIGSLSKALPVAKITSVPSGIVTSKFFRYDPSTYNQSDTLIPGRGYWVKTTQSGKLVLDTASTANNIPPAGSQPPPPPCSATPPSNLTASKALGSCGDGKYHPQLNWQAATSLDTKSYNIYRQDCDQYGNCTNEGVIATVGASTFTYIDCAILYGYGNSPSAPCHSTYWVTTVDSFACESSGSNTVTVNTATCISRKTTHNPVSEHPADGIPTETLVEGNYPNPFNPTTTIRYGLAEDVRVDLRVYNVFGQEVRVLVSGIERAGYKSVAFDGSSLASGVYFYRLHAGNFTTVKKMILAK